MDNSREVFLKEKQEYIFKQQTVAEKLIKKLQKQQQLLAQGASVKNLTNTMKEQLKSNRLEVAQAYNQQTKVERSQELLEAIKQQFPLQKKPMVPLMTKSRMIYADFNYQTNQHIVYDNSMNLFTRKSTHSVNAFSDNGRKLNKSQILIPQASPDNGSFILDVTAMSPIRIKNQSDLQNSKKIGISQFQHLSSLGYQEVQDFMRQHQCLREIVKMRRALNTHLLEIKVPSTSHARTPATGQITPAKTLVTFWDDASSKHPSISKLSLSQTPKPSKRQEKRIEEITPLVSIERKPPKKRDSQFARMAMQIMNKTSNDKPQQFKTFFKNNTDHLPKKSNRSMRTNINHAQFLRLAEELEILEIKKRRKDLRDSLRKLMLQQQQNQLSKQMVDNVKEKPEEGVFDHIMKKELPPIAQMEIGFSPAQITYFKDSLMLQEDIQGHVRKKSLKEEKNNTFYARINKIAEIKNL